MKRKMGVFANIRQWPVVATLAFPYVTYASDVNSIESQLPADEIKQGCYVLFESASAVADEDSLGTPPQEINVKWKCDDLPSQLLDTYEIEGGAPKIVTSFIRNRSHIVVVAKWHICSLTSDFCGYLYRIFLYQYVERSEGNDFINTHKMKGEKLTGMEGIRDGKRVSFPLRSKEAINAALDRLER